MKMSNGTFSVAKKKLLSPEKPIISPVNNRTSGIFTPTMNILLSSSGSPFCTGTAMSLRETEIDVRTVLHVFQLVKIKENPGQWKLRRLQCFVLHRITLLVKQITVFPATQRDCGQTFVLLP